MKLASPKLWISIASVSFVALCAVVDVSRTSPGEISAVHGRVEDLQGRSGCSACHGGWFSTMTAACLECHAPIETQLDARNGLHGRLAPATAARCSDCHAEHHGANFAIVNDQSFRRAGFESTAEFDHELVGWVMTGRHLEVSCTDCHELAEAPVLPAGGQRYLGLAQDCGSCHEDPHEGRMQFACAACHGQTTWQRMHSEGHAERLPLVGGHGDLDCRACHAENGAHSLERMGLTGPGSNPRACDACHATPHSEPFSIGTAALAASAIGTSCVVCHQPLHTSFREPGLAVSAEQHAASGFRLDAPHGQGACAECHATGTESFAERYPERSQDECSVCHEDAHGGQFERGPFAGQECTACHDRLRFDPHAFTPAMHGRTAFGLTGQHADTDCNACHERSDPEQPRGFRGTDTTCGACHADAHDGFFAEVASAPPQPLAGGCGACHTTTAFREIPAPGFDHARFTAFAILGAHAESDCASCHVSTSAPDATGRTFGRVAEHFGEFQGCVTCHADPHEGRFDTPEAPALLAGRADCARCHAETSFRTLPYGFDHGGWTGFALAGAHAASACSACHEPVARSDALGRTWLPALGTACASCHIDPHEGQFELEGAVNCEHCHTPKLPDFLAFDHERDTRFPLRDQHEKVGCAECHTTFQSAQGEPTVRFRPLSRACVDCHGVNEDVLIRRTRRRG